MVVKWMQEADRPARQLSAHILTANRKKKANLEWCEL